MSYNSLNLVEGDNLTANNIRHIEAGMRSLDDQISSMRTSLVNILSDKGITEPSTASFNTIYTDLAKLAAPPTPTYTSTGSVIDVRSNITSGCIKIVFADNNSGLVGFRIAAYTGVTIDWGDGSAVQTVTTSYGSWTVVTHNYTVGSGQTWSGGYTQFVATITPLTSNGITGFCRHDTQAVCNTMLGYASQDVYYRYIANSSFRYCQNLEYIHISGGSYGTSEATFSMSEFASNCVKLKSAYCPNVAWTNVTSCGYIFMNCSQLTTIQMGATWNASNSTSYYQTFQNCSSLITAPTVVTTSATTCYCMFSGCTALTTIPGTYDLSSCTDCTGMFNNCTSLTALPLLNNLYNVKTCNTMFANCSSLVGLNDSQEDLDTETCTNFNQMFYMCASLEEICDIDFTCATNVNRMFYGDAALYILPNAFNFPALVGTTYVYTDSSERDGLDAFFANCIAMTTAPTITAPLCVNAYHLFYGCTSLVNVPDINLPACIRAHEMFCNCTSMVTAPHHLTLPACQNVEGMFYGCTNLRNAPEYESTDTLNLPEVLYAYNMFYNCTSLVNAPHAISLNKATHIYSMFYPCAAMTSAPATFSAPAATAAYAIFYGCTKMTTAPTMTLTSAIDCKQMFYGCSSLLVCPTLNLPAAQNLSDMFRLCTSLTSTLPYTFNSATNITSMFYDCSSLKILEKVQVGGTSCNITSFCYNMSSTLQTAYWPEPTGSGSIMWTSWVYYPTSGNTFKGWSNTLNCTNGTSAVGDTPNACPYIEHYEVSNCATALTITSKTYLTSIRLYTPSTAMGNITLTSCGLDATALDQLFTDLPTVSTARTIIVRGNPGALTCDTSIATAKNWVVTTV